MNQVTYKPLVRFRILATYWEAEAYVECWTETKESAETIARLLKASNSGYGDVSVQVDKVVS